MGVSEIVGLVGGLFGLVGGALAIREKLARGRAPRGRKAFDEVDKKIDSQANGQPHDFDAE